MCLTLERIYHDLIIYSARSDNISKPVVSLSRKFHHIKKFSSFTNLQIFESIGSINHLFTSSLHITIKDSFISLDWVHC